MLQNIYKRLLNIHNPYKFPSVQFSRNDIVTPNCSRKKTSTFLERMMLLISSTIQKELNYCCFLLPTHITVPKQVIEFLLYV